MLLSTIQTNGTATQSLVGLVGFVVVAGGIAVAFIVSIVRSARAESRESEAESTE